MLSKKSFQSKIDEATRLFLSTVEKLQIIQADISEQIDFNKEEIEDLNKENAELESMKIKTQKQIEVIGQFLG